MSADDTAITVIARILGELRPSFRETRAALNEMGRIVGSGPWRTNGVPGRAPLPGTPLD